MNEQELLKREAQREIAQMHKSERERSSWMHYTRYLGTFALLIVAPVVGGAYLGVWLDRRLDTYFWTAALIAVGVAVGVMDAYLFFRRNP